MALALEVILDVALAQTRERISWCDALSMSLPCRSKASRSAGRVMRNRIVLGSWQSKQPIGCVTWPFRSTNLPA